MNVAVWVVSALLAAGFLMAGTMKLVTPKAKLVENPRMGWAEPFSSGMLKFIGAAEVAGALGLILPAALDTATWLVPTAAVGLGIIMIGAVITHARRGENFAMNIVLLAMAIFVAVERLGPDKF